MIDSETHAALSVEQVSWTQAAVGLYEASRRLEHGQAVTLREVLSAGQKAPGGPKAEPLYTRARGRWQRYADQLAPVLPILAPWAEKMGYDL